MKIRGKRIVILGGTSGIGFAVARAALDEGARVVIASEKQDRVDRARAELQLRKSTESGAHTVDVASESEIRSFFTNVGPFDHLIYTAGDDLPLGPLAETDLENAQKRFRIRYWGAVTAVKHGSAVMRAGGSIVLTSGFSATRPRSGLTSQASIQSAVEGVTRALAVELAPLRVNAVSPGLSETPRWDALESSVRKRLYQSEARRLPLGRLGQPSEIATAYLYLMENTYATGNIIAVDGDGSIV